MQEAEDRKRVEDPFDGVDRREHTALDQRPGGRVAGQPVPHLPVVGPFQQQGESRGETPVVGDEPKVLDEVAVDQFAVEVDRLLDLLRVERPVTQPGDELLPRMAEATRLVRFHQVRRDVGTVMADDLFEGGTTVAVVPEAHHPVAVDRAHGDARFIDHPERRRKRLDRAAGADFRRDLARQMTLAHP